MTILGDLELKTAFSEYEVCDEPEGIRAQVISGADPSDAFTRISTEEGFYCSNDDINQCDDWSVSWCCDKWATGDRHCNTKGYAWTAWLDRDDPTGFGNTGDWETRTAFTERQVCSNPTGVQAFPLDGGSTEVTHIDTNLGFWCVNQEQSTGQCADFSVRFCCPQFTEGHCEHEGRIFYPVKFDPLRP